MQMQMLKNIKIEKLGNEMQKKMHPKQYNNKKK